MTPDLHNVTWTRSLIVAGAIVVAALIPVIGNDAPAQKPPRYVQRPVSDPVKLTGNRRVCLALDGQPLSVIEARYAEVRRDHNESGDSVVAMRGGSCWLKWHYTAKNIAHAERVRFYDETE